VIGSINTYIIANSQLSIHFHMRITKMNTLQFAVASIVDTTTGNGLAHHSSIRDNAALEQHGRKNRAISMAGLFAGIKTKLLVTINGCRARAK
jgi:hypothetical protein